jgi:formylmethanofuran dehydrogenase subunit B
MRERGNIAGADNVLSWRTGYPFGVNLSRGYPRFNPGEYTAAEMLARGEVDAALVVGSDPIVQLGAAAAKHLATIPTVVLADAPSATTRGARIWFATATYGINTPGTVYRMDDVPIPLRPAIDSPRPSDFDILSAIEARICEQKGVRREPASDSKIADHRQPARR